MGVGLSPESMTPQDIGYQDLSDRDEQQPVDLDKARRYARLAYILGAASASILLVALFIPGWSGFSGISYKSPTLDGVTNSFEITLSLSLAWGSLSIKEATMETPGQNFFNSSICSSLPRATGESVSGGVNKLLSDLCDCPFLCPEVSSEAGYSDAYF